MLARGEVYAGYLRYMLLLVPPWLMAAQDCDTSAGEKAVFTTRMTIGVVLAVLGFCFYSHCKLSVQRKPAAPIIKGVPDLIDPGYRLTHSTSGVGSNVVLGRKSVLSIR